MLRQILLTAVIAGAAASIVLSAGTFLKLEPLIRAAEVFEAAESPHAHGDTDHAAGFGRCQARHGQQHCGENAPISHRHSILGRPSACRNGEPITRAAAQSIPFFDIIP